MNQEANQNLESFSYDDKIVRWFTYATLLWGAVAMLLGVTIAFQLAYWKLNMGLEWLTFGRLRPLHTNAAIFAFVGNGMFAGVYYSLQRLCKARLFNDLLSKLHFWGWQLIIVSAAISLPLGMTTGKEYAELEWPIDIAITVVWVIFAVNFFGTLIRRRERHIYVAIWFYIATIVTVAVLHIVNSISIPVSLMKSYSIYAGAQDALIQWWYGHNAVAFFLTTPILGLMYYFVPKAANRPVYSYRLSIVHFWSLVFIYIWAGPHHLLYTALPEWLQTVGMVFSVALWAPSWGGMINGLLTLRGKWSEVRTNPVLKFLATAVTFYGMSTFEGPLLSVKSVNSVAHFTDWVIGHVHAGTIGWNYMLTAGMLYYLVPKLWKTKIYSIALANFQFWTATIGLFFYIVSMWIAGVTQGMMWRAIDGETGTLVYPNFIETVTQIIPMYWVRAIGGTLVLISFLVMIYNLLKSIAASKSDLKEEIYQAPALSANTATGHRKLEGLPMIFTVLVLLSIIVGTVVEITPTFLANRFFVKSDSITPYTPLELLGRDVFIKEGCYTCHSQMVRPMVSEQLRYGKPSHISESRYDHPFQWGSRRIGPDLARVGSKYPHMWHYRHMLNPRHMTHDSIMPNYPWLARKKIHYDVLEKKMRVMQALGVPYSDSEVASSVEDAQYQANEIADILAQSGVDKSVADKEIVALISYLQRLGSEVAEGITDQEVEE
ncbi:MAG: cytochrome-c oxidase, cbb3-type subunit I [Halobacteriovoraceae bacterium]|nr:cytochrome-c oxidase, cbb3-type subunit I [Halobacteriovoraceae bacterium]MCB9093936.1 cytochrome-c oxidase, cbb3-type subunit I [Halobacteriovoraceae bacterium]